MQSVYMTKISCLERIKNSLRLSSKNQTIQLEHQQITRYFTKEDIQMANEHMKQMLNVTIC